jgi:hypothetical protein
LYDGVDDGASFDKSNFLKKLLFFYFHYFFLEKEGSDDRDEKKPLCKGNPQRRADIRALVGGKGGPNGKALDTVLGVSLRGNRARNLLGRAIDGFLVLKDWIWGWWRGRGLIFYFNFYMRI